MDWIKLHYSTISPDQIVYIQVRNICSIFVGNDGKTHISFRGDETNWITVTEKPEEVMEMFGVKEDVKEDVAEETVEEPKKEETKEKKKEGKKK